MLRKIYNNRIGTYLSAMENACYVCLAVIWKYMKSNQEVRLVQKRCIYVYLPKIALHCVERAIQRHIRG